MEILLARIYYPVKTLGPGKRVGIWLAGCNKNCHNCISPELKNRSSGKSVSIEKVYRLIESISGRIDGFTISGGEPFLEPEALSALLSTLKKINDDIIVYTGYTYNELQNTKNPFIRKAIDNCAVLIAGPYMESKNDNKGLRGSSNQECYIFKNKELYKDINTAKRKKQSVLYGRKIFVIGIPNRGDYDV